MLDWENEANSVTGEDDEVKIYIDISRSDGKLLACENVLDWWKDHETVLPKLSILARSILPIPARSSSSERAFSVAGRILDKRRCLLKPESVDSLVFLHKNR